MSSARTAFMRDAQEGAAAVRALNRLSAKDAGALADKAWPGAWANARRGGRGRVGGANKQLCRRAGGEGSLAADSTRWHKTWAEAFLEARALWGAPSS